MGLHRRTIAILVVVGALAIGLIVVLADGGGTDDQADDQAAGTTSSTGARDRPVGSGTPSRSDGRPVRYVPEPGTPEAAAYERIDELYEVFEATDRDRLRNVSPITPDPAIAKMTKRVCGLMSQAVLKDIQESSPALDDDPAFACRQTVGLHLGREARSGGLAKSKSPTITGVRVDGDEAIVTLRFPGYPPRKMRMVDEDGRWKLDANLTK